MTNFSGRHGETVLSVVGGQLTGTAADGSTFGARLPFSAAYAGVPDAASFALEIQPPADWGLLLVRKGGFGIARLVGERITDSKIGQRHVQGRTKAGGQSQQRFARRRDNQARQAYEAAAEHAARLLTTSTAATGLVVVTGGDHAAVDEVLADPRLRHLTVVGPWLPVQDPKRDVLEQAVVDAGSAQVEVVNA